MSREFILVVILVVLCCAIASLILVLALALGSWTLAKGLMGFLSQLYGNDDTAKDRAKGGHDQERDCSPDGPGAVRRWSAGRGGSRALPSGR